MASWVSSAWAVAGCVGSAVVEKIVGKGLSYLGKRMLPDDSEEALRRVKTALPQIRAVMGVAEALKMKDPSCREWVQQFRAAVDAAEDVLDELEYKKLENMVQNRDDQVGGSSSSSKKRKTCAITISGDILERLKKAVTMLDEATAGVDDLLQRADRLGIRYLSESQLEVRTHLRRETTSILAERKVFGRDIEKAEIIGWLKRETEAPLSSVGIVGVGGLGKTTLAQSVFQELSGSGYFEKTIWVCVSTEFSVEGITAKILAVLVPEERCHGDNSLNVLQQRLKEEIHSSNKVLLILDDVWEDGKRRDWEQLIAPLRFAQQGSKILFTTRQKSVADLLVSVINTEHESLALKDLKEQELRLLFNSYAFQDFNPNEHRDLQAIGDQIVKRLHGNPLAARVIGSLLNSRMNSVYWRGISNHDSLINLDQANDVIEVLKLSYYNLPADLQVCFRFCSIFPPDYKFVKEKLIEMWIASGFIRKQSCEEKRPEDIGEDYFNNLLRKSFFEKSYYGKLYVMHDLIHELAQNVSIGECFRVQPNDKSIPIPSTVRHVSVHVSDIQRVSHLENVRSLIIIPCSGTNPDIFDLLNNLIKKSLRLLKIYGSFCCRLPAEISCLVHLRYLSVQVESIEYLLPSSIYKLYHLQVLEFAVGMDESSYFGVEMPGIGNLVSLRHMRLPHHILPTICGVHRLTSLQELTFFVRQESGHCINELHTLNNLRHLTIHNIENIRDPAEASSANLFAKENLQSLSLKCSSDSNLDNPEQIFDNLQPHQNLMELEIENYKGQRSPIWMMGDMPPNLSSLKLYRCPYMNNQPIFGQMPHLKILHIIKCAKLVQLPDIPFSLTEFLVQDVGLTCLPDISQKSSLRSVNIIRCQDLISLNGFLPQGTQDLRGLEELRIEECVNLAELPMHAFRTFVSLKELSISNCRKLTRLPWLPLSLIKFHIRDIGVSALPEYFESPGSSGGPSPSLREVEIKNCPNLTALNGFLQQDNIDLHGLEKLRIVECVNLAELPMHEFRTFVSLKELYISNFRKLTRLPWLPLSLIKFHIRDIGVSALPEYFESPGSSGGPSPSLREVEIKNCPNLTALNGFLQQDNIDLHGLQKLRIEECVNLAELPMHAFRTFVSLKELYISNCRKLTRLPWLPLSLIKFHIRDIGVSALPEYFESPGSSGGPTPSLREVEIKNCPNLTALNGFLQQDNIDFRAINIIEIQNCENLVRIPMGAFSKFGSLNSLNIYNCPKLVAVDNQNNLLPLKLKSLSMGNCGELDEPLLESSLGLTTLTSLIIQNSANITHIPSVENVFRSLRSLGIIRCPKLIELSLMQRPHNADQGSNLASLKIDGLYIDQLSLLLIEPLRSQRSVMELSVSECSGMETLPEQWLLQNNSTLRILTIWNASTLQSLPASMARLTALEYLFIRNADLLVELPDLPASLRCWTIKSFDGTVKFK